MINVKNAPKEVDITIDGHTIFIEPKQGFKDSIGYITISVLNCGVPGIIGPNIDFNIGSVIDSIIEKQTSLAYR